MSLAEQQLPRRSGMTIWGLMEAGSVLLCAATITGFLGRLWWILELTTHFRVHLAAGLAVVAVICFAKKRWRMAVVCSVFATINAVLVLSVLVPGGITAPQAGTRLRLAAINVHTENRQSDLVLEFLRNAGADVILLMEVNQRWMTALESLRTNFHYVIAEPRADNFGIALFSRLPLTNDNVIELGSAEVPSIAADVIFGSQTIHLLGTHPLPPGSPDYARFRNGQLRQIAFHARRQTLPVVVVGDLNTTPWSPRFADLLTESGLRNTSQGRGLFASRPAWLPFGRIPLDHCLVSPSILVVSKRLGPDVGSDHLPVVVDLLLTANDNVVSNHQTVSNFSSGIAP